MSGPRFPDGDGLRTCLAALTELTTALEARDLYATEPEQLAELAGYMAAVHDAAADYMGAITDGLEYPPIGTTTAAIYARVVELRRAWHGARRIAGAYRTLSELRPVIPALDRLLGARGAKTVAGRVLRDSLTGKGRGGK